MGAILSEGGEIKKFDMGTMSILTKTRGKKKNHNLLNQNLKLGFTIDHENIGKNN